MLYIVATPIGNLKDITLRSLEVLKEIDIVICEDSRRTSLLLSHYNIKKSLIILNDYNESRNFLQIIERLKDGEKLALVSDAGTPLISDPGYKLVRECLHQGIQVDSLPGPSSVITALVLSGLPPNKFMFLGYLPEKPGHRTEALKKLTPEVTYIIFVAPHKIIKTLQEVEQTLGDIEITLAKELTKIHQNVQSKKISIWLQELKNPKGEYILLLRLNSS